MKERPILLRGWEVRAILAGIKTQTRRIVKFPSWVERVETVGEWFHGYGNHPERSCESSRCQHISEGPSIFTLRCPFGVPGDRLWVRETWHPTTAHSHGMDACDCGDVNISYAADGEVLFFPDGDELSEWEMPKAAERGYVSPRFMPRWASRITLEIERVRVRRVQDISEEDALAEGITPLPLQEGKPGAWYQSSPGIHQARTALDSFRLLWDSIHGTGAWSRNDWVFAVAFRRAEAER